MILPKLKELSEKDGFNHEIKIFVSYNLCSKELTDNQSEIYQFAPDVLFLFIDLDSLIPEYLDLVKIKSEERRKVIDLKFSYLLAIVEKFTKERPASTIIIHNFSVPSYSPLGIADNREAVGLQRSIQDLNRRMEDYFKDNNIQKTGDWRLHLKTVVMFTLFFAPYFLILALNMPFWAHLLLSVVMGIGMAGVGMNVMHDGNHGSYSSKVWLNKIMGGSIYILAGNVYNWQVQHNVLHQNHPFYQTRRVEWFP